MYFIRRVFVFQIVHDMIRLFNAWPYFVEMTDVIGSFLRDLIPKAHYYLGQIDLDLTN